MHTVVCSHLQPARAPLCYQDSGACSQLTVASSSDVHETLSLSICKRLQDEHAAHFLAVEAPGCTLCNVTHTAEATAINHLSVVKLAVLSCPEQKQGNSLVFEFVTAPPTAPSWVLHRHS